MENKPRWKIPWLALVFLGLLAVQIYVQQRWQAEPLPYSDFIRELKDGNVSEIRVYGDHIEGTLAAPPLP